MDVRVVFTSVYDQLTPVRQEEITGLEVRLENSSPTDLPVNRITFVVTRRLPGVDICLDLYFTARQGVEAATTSLCVRP